VAIQLVLGHIRRSSSPFLHRQTKRTAIRRRTNAAGIEREIPPSKLRTEIRTVTATRPRRIGVASVRNRLGKNKRKLKNSRRTTLPRKSDDALDRSRPGRNKRNLKGSMRTTLPRKSGDVLVRNSRLKNRKNEAGLLPG
jgi:hypothetical protein